jgi:uncharacterized membrane protein YeaQ/YmgE (transglycosylase-associated protein family)
MSLQALIILIIVGAIAGWLAGIIVKGVGFGLIGNIIVGIVSAFIGTWVLGALGVMIGGGIIASIINATIGAVILLFIISLVKRAYSLVSAHSLREPQSGVCPAGLLMLHCNKR